VIRPALFSVRSPLYMAHGWSETSPAEVAVALERSLCRTNGADTMLPVVPEKFGCLAVMYVFVTRSLGDVAMGSPIYQ
jgi:hypothetical protein